MGIKEWIEISEIINQLGVGIGAILAGCASIPIIGGWYKEFKRKRDIHALQKLYPREQLGKRFKLIRIIGKDKVYLLDEGEKKIHWISSSLTLADMNFWFDDVKDVEDSVIEGYQEGSPFYTRGERGL